MRRSILVLGGILLLAWLAFVLFGMTFGWTALAGTAADFEAWIYEWAAFPTLLAATAGIAVGWLAPRALRWIVGWTWMERLAELHEEGMTIKALGQNMAEASSLATFLRGAAEWEERTHVVLKQRAKIEAVAFRAPASLAPPELRARYFSDEHRKVLALHTERLGRLQRVIANHAFGLK
jgi:hypothetical protein